MSILISQFTPPLLSQGEPLDLLSMTLRTSLSTGSFQGLDQNWSESQDQDEGRERMRDPTMQMKERAQVRQGGTYSMPHSSVVARGPKSCLAASYSVKETEIPGRGLTVDQEVSLDTALVHSH